MDTVAVRRTGIRALATTIGFLASMLAFVVGGATPAHADCLFWCPPVVATPTTLAPSPTAPAITPTTVAPVVDTVAPAPVAPPVSLTAPGAPAVITDQPQAAAQLLALVNGERAARGLRVLTMRADVTVYAAAHSQEMARAGTIFHNDGFFTSTVRSLVGGGILGENVAQNPDIADAHARLMASPGHRANILNPRFTVVGIAVAEDPTGEYYVTQDFVETLRPPGTVLSARPTPTPPVTRPVAEPTVTVAPHTGTTTPVTAPPASVVDARDRIAARPDSTEALPRMLLRIEPPANDNSPATTPASGTANADQILLAMQLLLGAVGICGADLLQGGRRRRRLGRVGAPPA